MSDNLQGKSDFENMFHPDKLDELGDYWFIKWRSSQSLRYRIYLQLISKYINPSFHKKYLEIGCAECFFMLKIKKKFPWLKIFGTDISDNVINWNKKRFSNFEFYQCALPNVGFQLNSFDIISVQEVLYYLEHDEQIKALKNIASTLKPNGLLFLSGTIDGGILYWDENWIYDAVSKYFTIEEIEYQYNHFYSLIEKPLLRLMRWNQEIPLIIELSMDDFSSWQSNTSSIRSKWGAIIRNSILNRIFIFGARLANMISKKILGWRVLSFICYKINKLFFPIKGRSNIIIIAKKT